MPLDPEIAIYIISAAAAEWSLRVFVPLVGGPRGPISPAWPGDEVFFVDASAATARTAGGEASLVKLAVLHRRPQAAWERLYAPLVGGSGAPPVLYVPGGERIRQAIVYVVELASLLALARSQSLAGEPLGPQRVLIRHGPLVQQLAHYYSTAYDVEQGVAEVALRYAGLDTSLASRLVLRSRPRGASDRVNLGFLMGLLLDQIREETKNSGGSLLFAGVVEDTSRSRVLVADLLAEATLEAAQRYQPSTTRDMGSGVSSLVNGWAASYRRRRGHSLSECLCDQSSWPSADPMTLAREFISPLQSELVSRFDTGIIQVSTLPPASMAAAALASSGALPDLTDSELLYNLVYFEDCQTLGGPPCLYTAPRSRAAVAEWARVSLGQRKRERLPTGVNEAMLADAPRSVKYSYMLVEKPPDCLELLQKAQKLSGLSACELAGLIDVPPAIRVEWMEPADQAMRDRLLEALRQAARLVVYGYPPQLLVVDRASRVTLSEYLSLEVLVHELARRRQPYRGFLRGWEARDALVWPAW